MKSGRWRFLQLLLLLFFCNAGGAQAFTGAAATALGTGTSVTAAAALPGAAVAGPPAAGGSLAVGATLPGAAVAGPPAARVFLAATTFPRAVTGPQEKQTWEQTTILIGNGGRSGPVAAAAETLAEEVEKRTGLHWEISGTWPKEGSVIILQLAGEARLLPPKFSGLSGNPGALPALPALPASAESYRITGNICPVREKEARKVVLIEAKDERGILFGAGRLLRLMRFSAGSLQLAFPLALSASPEAAIRGHQLGYRHTANSYDGWTPAQYEQYIRELAIFGVNSIEAIPFDKGSPHFTLSPREMNIRISRICEKYGLDFWLWSPADFPLDDTLEKARHLKMSDSLFRELPRLDHVFVPGGDPGDNPPGPVMPYLERLSATLQQYHPKAKMWLSLQGFTPEMSQYVYHYIREKKPKWLAGLVAGPGSPPLAETRSELPPAYALRHYPDITHTVRCQYPVPWWDPSFNFTLGREPVNPRPVFYTGVYRQTAAFTNGFITYSDGIHDDVNKIVWSLLGWDSSLSEQEMLLEYASFFFGAEAAEEAATALLELEKNWEGPIAANKGIDACLRLWENIGKGQPSLSGSWRWRMHLMRAYYDAYTRRRAIYEQELEQEVNQVLLKSAETGPAKAMENAKSILSRADQRVMPVWRQRIVALCDSLFQSVCLQTSVGKYGAKNPERGAVLDFLDRPLNNRWWLEDAFRRIDSLESRQQQVKELETIARWENPGKGSFYDNVGNVSRSPHVLRGPGTDIPGFDWWESGYSRERLSHMVSMRWPEEMVYNGLDTKSGYLVRVSGYGECLLRANGRRLKPSRYGKGIGEIKEFHIPPELLKNGRLTLTWDTINEEHLNWRQHSRVSEVWLIRTED
ncbi:hypothetical protein EDD80_112101 [Anseongella ginsenosidimutans]|uniref:Alpha glucuronidase N-terminal domain-containing protein n=2 Tax=Anseongella ginsenosidimutans TaxID=496056 RepID=A0A4R3KNX6_9SPHI|nr:hypothetical protein EDD80_112101 [Anseongella ginsenosidimutans]